MTQTRKYQIGRQQSLRGNVFAHALGLHLLVRPVRCGTGHNSVSLTGLSMQVSVLREPGKPIGRGPHPCQSSSPTKHGTQLPKKADDFPSAHVWVFVAFGYFVLICPTFFFSYSFSLARADLTVLLKIFMSFYPLAQKNGFLKFLLNVLG